MDTGMTCRFIKLIGNLWIGTGSGPLLRSDPEFRHIYLCLYWGPRQ